MHRYLLSLGSNIGDRKQNLLLAVKEIAKLLRNCEVSSIYQSQALLPFDFDVKWDMPYLNMCVVGYSELSPHDFLSKMQHIEKALGKEINALTWSPRTIDIDILLVDQLISNLDHLRLPHPGLLVRDFFLIPASEIWPDATHPIIKASLINIRPTILTQLKKYED